MHLQTMFEISKKHRNPLKITGYVHITKLISKSVILFGL